MRRPPPCSCLDLLSTVSHELRTPLTSITGYLELLREGSAGSLTAEQTALLDVVGRNAQRLGEIVEDVLALSAAAAAQRARVPVDVAALVSDAVATVRPAAESGRVRLVADAAANVLVSGDGAALERMLLNLLSNALKFTPPGGRVHVRAGTAAREVRLQVSDTGIGIPADEQDRLFSRHFRASNAASLAIEGTGLGLTIVRDIVAEHGGSLQLASLAGEGTTVTVVLPRAEAETGPGTPPRCSALPPTVRPLAH